MNKITSIEKMGIIYREPLSHLKSRNTPDWAKHGVIYEVFSRSFCKQGTFSGMLKKIPELKRLGVDIIWFMPIFPIGKKGKKGSLGCPYSIRDYFETNPEYGTKADFKKVVDEIHNAGMRVIIDMVANHSSNDHVAMEEHPDWFRRDEHGKFTRKIGQWSDVTDLNYDNQDLWNYMKEAILYWVREFNIDGFRCDVAGLVPEEFWVEAREELEAIKSDIFMLAEWEDPNMHTFSFDSTYDWVLYYKYLDVLKGKAPAEHLVDLLVQRKNDFPSNSLRLRFIENHDMGRATDVFGPKRFRSYATFIFTIDGIPLLYNGQEVGDPNFLNLFEKQDINWNRPGAEQFFDFYKFLISLRKKYPVFTDGDFTKIKNDHPEKVVTFLRSNETGQRALVAINFSSKKVPVKLDFPLVAPKKIYQVNSQKEIALHSKKNKFQLGAFDSLILILND